MREGGYHHGNLRAELLAAAGVALRQHGPEGVSLRELARETGVSKSAPNRHFRDKQALLKALAVAGFERLDAAMIEAVASAGALYAEQLRAAAGAFVDFAVRDGALLDLMFSLAKAGATEDVGAAANRVFTTLGELIGRGQDSGALGEGDPTRLRLLMAAMFQGIASLVSSGRVLAEEATMVIDDAVELFLVKPAPRHG